MADRRLVAHALAAAFVANDWEPRAMAERAGRVCGPGRERLLAPLARRVTRAFPAAPVRIAQLADWIYEDAKFRSACVRSPFSLVEPATASPLMRPPPAALRGLELPHLPTPGDVAAWLDLTVPELDWFAGIGRRRSASEEKCLHYRASLRSKGNGRFRLLEAPKPRMKELQRRILRELLERVPSSPHGFAFTRGRGAVACASLHEGRAVVLSFDLADFFTSIHAGRVFALFSTLGYPEATARILTGLCTTLTPSHMLESIPRDAAAGALFDRHRQIARLRERHLPQGSPTSPALSNLAAWRLDRRLAGLAASADAVFTRYADDLTFSGGSELARGARTFAAKVHRIVCDEGFTLCDEKSRVARRSQQQRVVGLVVNQRVTVARSDLERLEATLYNCVRSGPEAQNRSGVADFQAHLRGRVAWVEHVSPAKGARLRSLFERIQWPVDG